MNRNVMKRLWPCVAAAVAIASTTVTYLPATSTYAVSPHSLTDGEFTQVAQQGFGDLANSWSWSMQYYKNRLYVGTNRNFLCAEIASFDIALPIVPYPPPIPNLTCPGPVSALPPTLGAQIWSVDPSISVSAHRPITQTDWQQVYTDQATIPMTVSNTITPTLGPRDMGWRGMSVYNDGDPNGPALYVSGVGMKPLGGNSVPPPALLRTTDGTHFQPVPSDPNTTLGSINTLSTIPAFGNGSNGACCMRGQASIVDANGTSYFFILIGTLDGEGAIFVSQHPNQGNDSFVQLTPPTMQVFEMATFNGHLYLGVQSLSGGYQVVRTDCFYPDPSNPKCGANAFTTVVPDGGGLGANGDDNVLSMHVFTTTQTVSGNGVSTPHLYVGTDGFLKGQAAEIVRINQDDSWDLIMGKLRTFPVSMNNGMCSGILTSNGTQCTMFPKSGLDAGFDWPFNWHVWRMEDYQGVLYAGTLDADVYLFNNTPFASLLKPVLGFDLWASTDGVHFAPVTTNGFNDSFNEGVRSLQATPDGLFLGSADAWFGTKVYEGSVSQAALSLAPQNLQSEATGVGGTALAWDPSAAARTYHVYRSTATRRRVPTPALPPRDPETGQAMRAPLPRFVWVPGPYTEIGQTQGSIYADRTARWGGHYSYYIVAEDGSGNLSAPSNVGAMPSLVPAATFHGVLKALTYQYKQGRIGEPQEAAVRKGIWAAYVRLLAHDPQGSHDDLETVRQGILSASLTPQRQLYADNLAALISRLEKRLTLVSNHILRAAQTY